MIWFKIDDYLYQIVFQITFIQRIFLIRIPLFQVSITIFFYIKMRIYLQPASKYARKSLLWRAFFFDVESLFVPKFVPNYYKSFRMLSNSSLIFSIDRYFNCLMKEKNHNLNMNTSSGSSMFMWPDSPIIRPLIQISLSPLPLFAIVGLSKEASLLITLQKEVVLWKN